MTSREATHGVLEDTMRSDWALLVSRVAGLTGGDLQLAEDTVQEGDCRAGALAP